MHPYDMLGSFIALPLGEVAARPLTEATVVALCLLFRGHGSRTATHERRATRGGRFGGRHQPVQQC